MAKIKRGNTTVTRGDTGKQLVINELHIQSADRTKKDVGDFILAVQHAESTHNPNRVALFNVYDNIAIDGFLSGIIKKRTDAVCNKTIIYKDKAGKKVDAFDDIIEGETFQKVVREIMNSQFDGVSGMEFVPGSDFMFEEIPKRHIRLETGLIVLEQYGEEGYEFEKLPNVWVIGNKHDLGLKYVCAPYSIWKRGNIADWAQYIEIYGQPVMITRYEGYDEAGRLAAHQLVQNAGSSLRLALPKELSFEILDGKANSNGDGKLQDTFRKAMNEEMAIHILGNTETTSSSSSSGYAQAKEHGKQQLDITKSDIKFVQAKLNNKKFIEILRTYGFPVQEAGKFEFEKELDLAELKNRAEIDEKMEASGLPIDDDYKYSTYGIPKPANYDKLKKEKEAQKNPVPAPGDPQPGDPAPDPKGKDPVPGKKDPKAKDPAKKPPVKKLSLRYQILAALADFFDPARLK